MYDTFGRDNDNDHNYNYPYGDTATGDAVYGGEVPLVVDNPIYTTLTAAANASAAKQKNRFVFVLSFSHVLFF